MSGADTDADQLALTEQLFDAALAELDVVARGSPYLLAGDFNVEPTKIPCLSKGISAGLRVDLDAAWSATKGQQPAVTPAACRCCALLFCMCWQVVAASLCCCCCV